MGKFRYRVECENQEERDILTGIRDAARESKLNLEDVKHGWIKEGKHSLFFKNPAFKEEEEKKLEELKSHIVDWVASESPIQTKKNLRIKGKHLLLIDPADVHIGKLCSAFEAGKDYNSDIAVQRVFDGVSGIINNAKGWDIEQIVFIGGNDILHIDTPKNTTTSGTTQDTDGMWYDNFMKACKLYQQILNELAEICDVKFIYNPSNHDYTNGFFLAQLIEAYFKNDQRITFDVSIAHRKYFRYYSNLIGTTHGDGAKTENLGALMAYEAKKYWADTEHKYFYTHHLHHKVSKDLIGCTVETLRSPSESDSWHSKKGFVGVPKAIEGFIHHRNHGQICRLTHIF